MKEYIKYLKREIDGNCYYLKTYGTVMHKSSDWIDLFCDSMIVRDNDKAEIVNKKWIIDFNITGYKTISEKEWNDKYKETYNTMRNYIKDLGTYCSYDDSLYIKINEITEEIVTADIIRKLGEKFMIFSIIEPIPKFYNLPLNKITEEEWNKVYEEIYKVSERES